MNREAQAKQTLEHQAEKVIADRQCRCGGRFMVLQMKGESSPRVMHNNPACEQFDRLKGMAFFEWVNTGKEPDTEDTPKANRQQRRRQLREGRGRVKVRRKKKVRR
jgi:hypothetical protein